jgi:uncharacterized Ntn-hydrolase superfamily protein
MVDKNGRAAAYTGAGCHHWAGHIVGEGYACQGNILIPGTVEAMAEAFEQARKGMGELAEWLVAALAAGQALDLRVDDDPEPIARLSRLVEMHHLYFGATDPADLIPLAEVAVDLQDILRRTGYYNGPADGIFSDDTRKALRALVGVENLEERWDGSGDLVDRVVVDFLQERFSNK